jgi:predicted dienelactone hydrolase
MDSGGSSFGCGLRAEMVHDPSRGRPATVDVWYPVALGVGSTAVDAPVARGRHPVVVLSHGAFGAARNYAWLSEFLARGCAYGAAGRADIAVDSGEGR